MLRRASAVLGLALANVACSKDPVLGADVDLTTVPAASSVPFASASARPVFSRPPLIQQLLAGFPACVIDLPPRRQRIVGCKQVGEVMCWRDIDRTRSMYDENQAVSEIRPLLARCFRPALLPSSLAWATIGILPNGRICAPSFMSSETLPPQRLACAARRLHAYRTSVADRSSGLTFQVVFQVGAPVLLRATPTQ
jgi:hypothetical protein